MTDEMLPAGPQPKELAVDYIRRVTASLGVPVTRLPTPSAETQTLGAEGKKVVQRARTWGQVLAIVATALAAVVPLAIGSYHSLADEAAARAQSAKQLAEDGYQVTREAVTTDRAARAALERRVAELEQALRAGSPDPHRRVRGATSRRPVSPLVVPATPAPRALPRDLDQAQRQVQRQVSAPPAPVPPPPRGDAAP
jgi:hypothetical protein